MSQLKFEMHDRERSKEAKAILRGLVHFNRSYGGDKEWRELTLSCKDARGRVVAGLNGYSDWGWLFVKLLWVSDEFRGKGLGQKLMVRAEAEARKRKCHGIWLDTFEFQAPGFYEKLGFKKFGELSDYPKGYKRHFYEKRLTKRKPGSSSKRTRRV